jgi:hypothetical protein
MKDQFKSFRLGLSATAIAMVPNLLPVASAACTGVCGSCGGSCAGIIVGIGASGLIMVAKLSNRKKDTIGIADKVPKGQNNCP